MDSRQQQALDRLTQILRLVEREDSHLLAVRQRLFEGAGEGVESVTEEWLETLLAMPEGIDRLESFGAKFGRMQDTIMDKLLPQLLKTAGENPGTAIDNLNRAERLKLVQNADNWIAMRMLRNMLVHEYIETPADMLAALRQARDFTNELHNTYLAIDRYTKENLSD